MKGTPETHVEDLLACYCEGALPDGARAAVAAHLAACAACRAAEAEVRAGLAWARCVEPARLPEPDAARTRSALAKAPLAPTRRWLPLAAAAVVVAVLAGTRFAVRVADVGAPAPRPGAGGLILEPDPGAPTRFEQTALDLHAEHAGGRLALDLRSSSVTEVRQWAEQNAGLSVNLALSRPTEDGDRYVIEGARRVPFGAGTALAVAYRVEGRPVTLLTARAEDTPERTPEWTSGGKRVRFRRTDAGKLLSWTNSGQAYALVSDFAGYGQQSCLLCHASAARRSQIQALGQP